MVLRGVGVDVLLAWLLGSDCAGVTDDVLRCDQVSIFQVSLFQVSVAGA